MHSTYPLPMQYFCSSRNVGHMWSHSFPEVQIWNCIHVNTFHYTGISWGIYLTGKKHWYCGANQLHFLSGGCAPLSWELRLKIAIGAARGLVFLHASEKQVIYRDFKASNILLDAVSSMLCNVPLIYQFATEVKCWQCFFGCVWGRQNYNAKLSDFGLAKLGPTGSNSHITTRVMGTYGYAAPEYVATGTCPHSSHVTSLYDNTLLPL